MTSEKDNKNKLEEFFENEYHSLKSFVKSRVESRIDREPEDIIQDVALKLFSGAARYSPINNVAGFVYRSIRNRIVDLMRTGSPQNSEVDENKWRLIEFAEVFYGEADNSYTEEMIQELKSALLELKPMYQEIIYAIDFEGYSYHELAEELDVSMGTLMSRRHRAMGILHNKLKEHKKNYIN